MSGNTLIKFGTREEEAKAVAGLGDRFRVHHFKGRIYSVPSDGLIWLDETGIPYVQATDAEVETV